MKFTKNFGLLKSNANYNTDKKNTIYDSTPLFSKFQKINKHINKQNHPPTQSNRFAINQYFTQENQLTKSINIPKIKIINCLNMSQEDNNDYAARFLRQGKMHSSLEKVNRLKTENENQKRQKNYMISSTRNQFFGNDKPLTFGLVKYKRQSQMLGSKKFKQTKIQQQFNQSSIRNIDSLCGSAEYLPNNNCMNHPCKKAKYKLLQEGCTQDQCGNYCSKCAINLLQQGFKVEELKKTLLTKRDQPIRLKQIQQFEIKIQKTQQKLKKIQQKLICEYSKNLESVQNEANEAVNFYQSIFQTILKLRNQSINYLQDIKNQLTNTYEQNKKNISYRLQNLGSLIYELKQYRLKFLEMNDTQFQFLLGSLNNKVHWFQEEPLKQNIIQIKQNRLQKVIEQIAKGSQTVSKVEISFDSSSQKFFCQENINQPFRDIFPQHHKQQRMSGGNIELEHSPSFKIY